MFTNNNGIYDPGLHTSPSTYVARRTHSLSSPSLSLTVDGGAAAAVGVYECVLQGRLPALGNFVHHHFICAARTLTAGLSPPKCI